jgi:hypothetical protein
VFVAVRGGLSCFSRVGVAEIKYEVGVEGLGSVKTGLKVITADGPAVAVSLPVTGMK